MPDLSPEDVHAQLHALGLAPVDDEDLAEVTHRINAINEAVTGLEHPDEDWVEPLPVFWLSREETDADA